MAATIKVKFIRPSLEDLFEFELISSPGLWDYNVFTMFAGYPGLLSSTYEEYITPQELKDRRAELEIHRPDLAEMCWVGEECMLDILIDPNHPFYTEMKLSFNPLSLTHTMVFTFDTLESLKTHYFDVGVGGSVDTPEKRDSSDTSRNSVGGAIEQRVIVDGEDVTSTLDWLVSL